MTFEEVKKIVLANIDKAKTLNDLIQLTVDEYGLFREKITNMKSEFDYYFDGEGCYIITRNGEFFLYCCGTEAETQHIVELLKKDAANDVDIQHVGYSEEECGRDK